MTDGVIDQFMADQGASELVTWDGSDLCAALIPFVFDPAVGEHGALIGHLARKNGHWKRPVVGEALVIVLGPDAYISPSWYASKLTHGRVVPTWNYVKAHVYGNLVVHDDREWVGAQARRLTARHEATEQEPWSVDDAPRRFIRGQLEGIVGVKLVISRVEGKAKLSQNRSREDIATVITGLTARGDHESASLVRNANMAPEAPSPKRPSGPEN
jgi:transcriptional regulator